MTSPTLFDQTEQRRYNTTVQHYRLYMFSYGIISVLMVMKRFEKLEQFEECQKIIDAIREQEKRLEIKLFTEINLESINDVKKSYQYFALTGKNIINNSKYYMDLIIDEIESKYLTT